jgi:hypothetical protein
VSIAGFSGLEDLDIKIDLEKPDCRHISGLETLTSLKKIKITFPYDKSTKVPSKLNLPIPDTIEELTISVDGQDEIFPPTLDFLPAFTRLKVVSVSSVDSLTSLNRFVTSPVTKLSVRSVSDVDLSALPFKETLVSLSGSLPKLSMLNGLVECKLIQELILNDQALLNIDALGKLGLLRKVNLGGDFYCWRDDDSKKGPAPSSLPLSVLKNHDRLVSVDYGGHPPSDFGVILEFKSKPTLSLKQVQFSQK